MNDELSRMRHGVQSWIMFLAVFVLPGFSSPSQGAEDLKPTAHDLVSQLMDGHAARILKRATPQVRQNLSAAQLKAAVAALKSTAGAFKSQVSARQEKAQGLDVVIVTCEFERAMVDIQFAFDDQGRIAGLFMRPAASAERYASPRYVKPEAFSNQDVVVDAGGWPLPGTFAIPEGNGPFPLVVLVHGSGPSDRDASFGPNKVFKDIADGLASQGVATLRFEKRTLEHAKRIAELTEFTPKEELIDDAVAAVELARTLPKVDGQRIYVLGHSLGGMMAPRIALADPTIAGIIVLAGAVRSLEQSMFDQMRYLVQFDGKVDASERLLLKDLESLARRVKTIKPGDPPVIGGGSSAPASYWLSMRDYNPPATASRLPQSILVLQGGRDYQVTTADYDRWRSALRDHPKAKAIIYPDLNHLFMTGEGRSHPGEYSRPGHVAESVILDVAKWVERRRSAGNGYSSGVTPR